MIGIAASLGIDFAVSNSMNLWAAHLRPDEAGKPRLVSVVFHEERPDLGEIKTVSAEPVSTLQGQPDQLLVPWTNYSRMESLWLWHAWRQDNNLFAIASAHGITAGVALGDTPTRLIRPALSVESGELDIFFVTADGARLGLARFRPGAGADAPAGAIAWRADLAAKPDAARAALGPAARGSARRIIMATQQEEELQLRLLDLADGKRPGEPAQVSVPAVRLIAGSEPGLRIDDKGDAHAAILVSTDAERRELAIVDARFPADGSPPKPPAVTPLRRLSLPAVAGGIAYQARADRPMRRDWVVLLADGSILHNLSGDDLMRPRGAPTTPLDLVAMSQATYILTVGAEGPMLEALR